MADGVFSWQSLAATSSVCDDRSHFTNAPMNASCFIQRPWQSPRPSPAGYNPLVWGFASPKTRAASVSSLSPSDSSWISNNQEGHPVRFEVIITSCTSDAARTPRLKSVCSRHSLVFLTRGESCMYDFYAILFVYQFGPGILQLQFFPFGSNYSPPVCLHPVTLLLSKSLSSVIAVDSLVIQLDGLHVNVLTGGRPAPPEPKPILHLDLQQFAVFFL